MSHTANRLSVLYIPRNANTESEFGKYYTERFSPDAVIMPISGERADGNDTINIQHRAQIWRDTWLTYETDEAFSAAILQCGSKKLVFCFYPQSDFSLHGEKYLSGDYLICRATIPDSINPENFGQIIVLSAHTSDKLSLPGNAISSADSDEINITLRP